MRFRFNSFLIYRGHWLDSKNGWYCRVFYIYSFIYMDYRTAVQEQYEATHKNNQWCDRTCCFWGWHGEAQQREVGRWVGQSGFPFRYRQVPRSVANGLMCPRKSLPHQYYFTMINLPNHTVGHFVVIAASWYQENRTSYSKTLDSKQRADVWIRQECSRRIKTSPQCCICRFRLTPILRVKRRLHS